MGRIRRRQVSLKAALAFAAFVAAMFFIPASSNSKACAPHLSAQHDRLKDSRFIAEGAKLFGPNCSSGYCHGASGAGGGGPRLRGRGLDAPYLFKVISNGISGTPMMAFKSELSQEDIWKLVAFIMSEGREEAAGNTETSSATSAAAAKSTSTVASDATKPHDSADAIVGSAQAGKALFFDSARPASCRACHSFQGEGVPIGGDLSKVWSKTARELFLSIIFPRLPNDSRYSKLTLTLKNGDKVAGIKKEEDDESIRVYDITELPAVLRTIQKADIAGSETARESSMPKDYAAVYTLKQLLDIVTFLRSSDPQSKPITLKDIF